MDIGGPFKLRRVERCSLRSHWDDKTLRDTYDVHYMGGRDGPLGVFWVRGITRYARDTWQAMKPRESVTEPQVEAYEPTWGSVTKI